MRSEKARTCGGMREPSSRGSRTILCDRKGTAVVEFALIAAPFFLLLAAIVEQAMIFYKQELLQTAVSAAGRIVMTGQANKGGYSQEQFRQQLCGRLPSFMGCGTIAVDVRPYASFTSARAFRPVDASGNLDPTQMAYDTGTAGSIVVVSGYSTQSVLFPNLNQFYGNAGSGKILISAQAAFRSEPY